MNNAARLLKTIKKTTNINEHSVVKRMFIIVSFDTSGNVTYKTFNNEREYQNALNNQ